MSKARKQKVINFLTYLDNNRLVKKDRTEDGEIRREPAAGVSIEYKDRKVLEIYEFVDIDNAFDGAVVIALDGREHFLEEDVTPKSLKHFEAFKKFRLPK